MGVNLGGRDIGVTEQFLHPAQLATRFEQVRGKGVPEQVRVHVHAEPLAPGPELDPRLDGARPQAAAVASHEQRRLTLARQCGAFLEPRLQRLHREAPDRNDARLVALADDVYHTLLQIDARHLQGHQLSQPESGGVQQLHDRPVACGERIARCDLKQPRHLVGIERLRQAACGLGRANALGGISRDARSPCCRCVPLAQQERIEAAHRRETALDAARGETGCVRMCGEHSQVLLIEPAPFLDAAAIAELHQCGKIARVARIGVRGQAPLAAHVAPEASHPLKRCGSHRPPDPRAQRAGVLASESPINSAMRARNSVLMPGWNLSRSALPSASSPTAPFSPSGTSATEPISRPSGPNRYSRCESRAWPHRGLPLANSDSKDLRFGSSAGTVRTKRGALGSGSSPISTRAAWKASKSSRSPASMRAMASWRGTALNRRRVKRCSRSEMASLARATRTSSASLPSSAACFSRSTSIWRSTSEMVESPRACGSLSRASTA